MNETDPVQTGGVPPASVLPSAPPVPPVVKPVYEADGRERVLLALCLGLGLLAADLLLSVGWNFWGLGIPVGVAAWYGVFLWYVGPRKLAESHTRLFFAAIVLLSLTFVLFSNGWFRFWNTGALLMLLTVHAFQLSGAGRKPWYAPSMLWERFLLLMDGLFGRLGALGAVFQTRKLAGPNLRRAAMAGLGVAVTVPLLLAASALLKQADMVFDLVTETFFKFTFRVPGDAAAKLILGVVAAPFLFSLLYALGRPKPRAEKAAKKGWSLDSVVAVMALGGLDVLYLFFVGVQSAALFGGAEYLAKMGVSYAEYARSGFFQLVFVALLNLAVLLGLLRLTGRQGGGWRLTQALATLLVVLSGVILISAAWRMTLYVLAYGLSFKRALTYWGMVMIALFLGAACVKVWREEFRFFRFAAVAALAGWLALNYANVDRLVAEYNVNAYLSGNLQSVDLSYLAGLNYEALPVLEEHLDDGMPWNGWNEMTMAECLAARGRDAKEECSHWETWSLPAWEWSIGWE